MTRLWLWTVTPSTVFSVLCHFVILYMVSIEIVSFCRIISLWNFQYRNHVHSITLMSFQIISQNLVQYKAWLDDVQRLRTVTSLDVSAVAGHHAMPAALLFHFIFLFFFYYYFASLPCRVDSIMERLSHQRNKQKVIERGGQHTLCPPPPPPPPPQ